MIEAKVIADSVSPDGVRLATLQLRYPKFIHSELMTHRVFSRNASSSRAVPTARYLEEVRSDELRATPVAWGANRPGMIAGEELIADARAFAQLAWRDAALAAAGAAANLLSLGLHKQVANRVLEPFLHVNVVVSSTEWSNFFALRLDPGAQPEMRALAVAMRAALDGSTPREVPLGAWHLPYADDPTTLALARSYLAGLPPGEAPVDALLVRVSTARCARVSYASHGTGKRSTVEEDLALYDKLLGSRPVHASPAEHPATPDHRTTDGRWWNPALHGNFVGWVQHRKQLLGEST